MDPVVDGMGRPVGLLARNDLIRALKERGPHARVADAMTGNIPTVNNRRCLDEAFRLLQEKSAPAVAVVDASERLVGLVTSETIGRQSELFYTDSEKFWAQSRRVPGALPRFPPSPEALVPVCMRSRVRAGDPRRGYIAGVFRCRNLLDGGRYGPSPNRRRTSLLSVAQ